MWILAHERRVHSGPQVLADIYTFQSHACLLRQVCVKHKPPRLVYHFQHERSLNLLRQNGVKRFLALEKRFHYHRDTPFSPSGAGLCSAKQRGDLKEGYWVKSKVVVLMLY